MRSGARLAFSAIGALGAGLAFVALACNATNDSLPPIPAPHLGSSSGGEDGAAPEDSGVVVNKLPDGAPGDACVETTSASPAGTVTKGPATLPIDPCGNAAPSALWWDGVRQVLYVGDDRNGMIWTWSDAAGFAKLATLPPDDAGADAIGGITGYGNLIVVARAGAGTAGALFQYDVTTTTGVATPIGGTVDPARARTGLAYDVTGNRFFSASYATGAEAGAAAGTIDLIGVTTTTAFVTGLAKPHGLLVSGTQFVAADYGMGAVLAFPLAAEDIADAGVADAAADDGGDAGDAALPPLYTTLAAIPGVDQLAAGPGGSILAGERPADGGAPLVHEIASDGGVTTFQPTVTFTELGGLAYDATNARVFVTDSNGSSVRTIKIYPAQ